MFGLQPLHGCFKGVYMKYIAKNKGLFSRIGLYSSTGAKFELPKGVTAKYADSGSGIYFQLFYNGEKLTPVATSIEPNQEIWTVGLQGGGYCDINPNTRTHSPKYIEKINSIVVYDDGAVSIVQEDSSWSEPEYFLDKKHLGKNLPEGYILSSMVGLKNKNGKCALFNTETGKFVTGFDFSSGKYEIVSILGADTKNVEHDVMFVVEDMSSADSKTSNGYVKKAYSVFTQDGKTVCETVGSGVMWQFEQTERTTDGKEKDFMYIAFSGRENDGRQTTTVVKIDLESQEVVFKTKIAGLAEQKLQENENFLFTDNGSLILYTNQPQGLKQKIGTTIIYQDGSAKVVRKNEYDSIELIREPASRNPRVADDKSLVFVTSQTNKNGKVRFGAFKLTSEALVERLLDDVWTEIKLKRDENKGFYLEYKNEKLFGRYRLSGDSESYESSPSEFISLTSSFLVKTLENGETRRNSKARKGATSLLQKAKAFRDGISSPSTVPVIKAEAEPSDDEKANSNQPESGPFSPK